MDFCLDWPGNGYNLLMRDMADGKNNSIFHRDSSRSILDFFGEYMESYEKIKKAGHYCLITGNHDTIRASHYLDVRELKLTYSFLFTMPGNPFIYYGDEIGMNYLELDSKEGGYTRTGSRTPMQWDDSPNCGFSTAPAEELYLPVDTAPDAPTAAGQEKDSDSLLHVVKNVLTLRKNRDDLKENDNLEIVYAKENERAFAYRRGNLLMCCNPSGKDSFIQTDSLPEAKEKLYTIGEGDFQNGSYVLGAQSFIIWEV